MEPTVTLTATEKNILRDAVKRRAEAAHQAQAATAEAQRTAAHFEAVLNTLVRLRDLDPALCQLRFDLDKDLWELNVAEAPPKPPPPPDIKDLIAAIQAKKDLPPAPGDEPCDGC